MPTGLLIVVFVAVTLGFVAIFFFFSPGGKEDIQRRSLRRLGLASAKLPAEVASSVLKKEILEQQKRKKRRFSLRMDALASLCERSGTGMKPNIFVFMTAGMAAAGAGATFLANRSIPSAVAAGIVLALVPYVHLKLKARKRIRLLTEQFPDALELLTNTLRAGQAFTTGLLTVAEEMPEPIATEFRITFEEQNYGVGMSEALIHLSERVGTMDMDFFVTAVNIQRETGGNLAEILDNLGRTIRQRFKILGHIRTLTAQGRLSGFIIGLMPAGLCVLLTILNPDYMGQMFSSSLGQTLLGASVGMQILGFLWINKIVKIKV